MERHHAAAAVVLSVACTLLQQAGAHGTLNLPESRNGGQAGLGLRQGGRTQPYCVAYWFTDETHMVGAATIADDDCPLLTCYDCEQNSCASTRLARTPWRAPGTAPLAGGPCGTIGWDGSVGRNASITRGTDLPRNFPYMPQGTKAPAWRIGGVESVAWGLAVNHGGGYRSAPPLCGAMPPPPVTLNRSSCLCVCLYPVTGCALGLPPDR